jgi:hypothetical protein
MCSGCAVAGRRSSVRTRDGATRGRRARASVDKRRSPPEKKTLRVGKRWKARGRNVEARLVWGVSERGVRREMPGWGSLYVYAFDEKGNPRMAIEDRDELVNVLSTRCHTRCCSMLERSRGGRFCHTGE